MCITLEVDPTLYMLVFRESGISSSSCIYIFIICLYLRKCTFGGSFNRIFQPQSNRALCNKTWQERGRELNTRLSFEIREMTLRMPKAVHAHLYVHIFMHI